MKHKVSARMPLVFIKTDKSNNLEYKGIGIASSNY